MSSFLSSVPIFSISKRNSVLFAWEFLDSSLEEWGLPQPQNLSVDKSRFSRYLTSHLFELSFCFA